jgi:VWFA-related protein
MSVIAGLTVKPGAQEASTQRETFRSAVDLVTIQASVKDGHGRIVNGLTTNDFEVRDNGQLRPILSLRSDRQSPLSLAILVDMSGSMRAAPRIAMARQAYDALLAQLYPGRDEVAVFTFDSSLHDRRDFTRDLATLKDALSDFEPFGMTSLYDVTAATARQLAGRAGSHKAIIVLTDGIDTSSEMTAREVSGLASSIDVPVFVVATVTSLDQRLMLMAAARSSIPSIRRTCGTWRSGPADSSCSPLRLARRSSHRRASSTGCASSTYSPSKRRAAVSGGDSTSGSGVRRRSSKRAAGTSPGSFRT